MINFKSSIAYFPSNKSSDYCDNFYFSANSKVIGSNESVVLSQDNSEVKRDIYAVCTGKSDDKYNNEVVAFKNLKKYSDAISTGKFSSVEALVKDFFSQSTTEVAINSEGASEQPKIAAAVVAICDDNVVVANVGNVKVFKVVGGVATEISTEHTQAKKMADMGMIAKADFKVSPKRKILTRYIGGGVDAAAPSITGFKALGEEKIVVLSGAFYDFADCEGVAEAVAQGQSNEMIAKYLMASYQNEDVGDFTALVISAEKAAEKAEEKPFGDDFQIVFNFDNQPETLDLTKTVAPVVNKVKEEQAPKQKAIQQDITEDFEEFDDVLVSKETDKKTEKTADGDVKIKKVVEKTIKAEATDDEEEDDKALWPTVVIFGISLIILALLFFFGIKMFMDDKSTDPTAKPEVTEGPVVTTAPTSEATIQPTETPFESAASVETEIPVIVGTVPPTPTATPKPTATPSPTAKVTPKPIATSKPTEEPTATPEDTAEPTIEPTGEPTTEPTIEPTAEPTVEPTVEPTIEPTVEPTLEPTVEPTTEPTIEPMATPE